MAELKKNDIYTVEITGYSSEGAGVARIEGVVVFVKNALMGEVCRVKILKVNKSIAYGKIEEILQPSSHRQVPSCNVFGKCGGCDFLHMDYEEELRFKRQRVQDALRKLGGLSLEVEGILGARQQDSYRNKVIYAVGEENGKPTVGFFRERSHQVIPSCDCCIQTDFSRRAGRAVTAWMEKHRVKPFDSLAKKGEIRHVFSRFAFGTGEGQVTLVSYKENLPALSELVENIRKNCPETKSIVLNINKTPGNTVLSGKFETLWGTDTIEDTLCGMRFALSPRSFYQVNRAQTEILYETAVQFADLTGEETVVDLYCGIGTITLCLAKKVKKVYGAEIVEQAILDAKENAKRNGIKNAEFFCADASDAAKKFEKEGLRPDVITVDPPRKGLSTDVIDCITKMAPKRVVYVSCDPGTLGRDLKLFSQQGYETRRAVAVDMFPRTRHVETVALLSRETAADSNG